MAGVADGEGARLVDFVGEYFFFFFSSRRRHTRLQGDWSSDVCSSDLAAADRQRRGCSGGTARRAGRRVRGGAGRSGGNSARRGGDDAHGAPRHFAPRVGSTHAQAGEEALTGKQLFAAVAAGVVGVALFPAAAHAWTPGTHVYLGEAVLANLHQLSGAVVDLLRAFPYDFLYGNIAADTSMAKKYAPVGRHCHAWHVGQEIFDLAHTDPLRAFGLGYLSHLAADAVAHN